MGLKAMAYWAKPLIKFGGQHRLERHGKFQQGPGQRFDAAVAHPTPNPLPAGQNVPAGATALR